MRMSKLAAAGLIGIGLALGGVAPAFAQVEGGLMTAGHMERSSKLIGTPVYNEAGQQFGTIEDVLVSPTGGGPIAVVSVGAFIGGGSNKLIAVPLSHVHLDGAKMTMAHATMQDIENMQSYGYYHMSNG